MRRQVCTRTVPAWTRITAGVWRTATALALAVLKIVVSCRAVDACACKSAVFYTDVRAVNVCGEAIEEILTRCCGRH